MHYPTVSAAPAAPVFSPACPDKTDPEYKLELFFNKGEATLFANGEQLIYFRSPVQVSGQEILDWMDKGLLTELVSLENLAANQGIPIIAREIAPVYRENSTMPEQSERSLLLNPQWFSIYFIAISGHLLRKITAERPKAAKTTLAELYTSVHAFFEPGKALADYENHSLYLRRLRNPHAA